MNCRAALHSKRYDDHVFSWSGQGFCQCVCLERVSRVVRHSFRDPLVSSIDNQRTARRNVESGHAWIKCCRRLRLEAVRSAEPVSSACAGMSALGRLCATECCSCGAPRLRISTARESTCRSPSHLPPACRSGRPSCGPGKRSRKSKGRCRDCCCLIHDGDGVPRIAGQLRRSSCAVPAFAQRL